jgi:hypothetical protein
VLAALVKDPEERARHLAEAADGPDEAGAAALEAAAASVAARGAPEAAIDLARRAAALTRRSTRRKRIAGDSPGAGIFTAGDPRQAEQLLLELLERTACSRHRAQVLIELTGSFFNSPPSQRSRRSWSSPAHGEHLS